MLVLTLKEGEYLMIGDNVRFTFDRVEDKDKISVAIDAPKDVKILRSEVHERNLAVRAEAGDKEAARQRDMIVWERNTRLDNAQRRKQAWADGKAERRAGKKR